MEVFNGTCLCCCDLVTIHFMDVYQEIVKVLLMLYICTITLCNILNI